MTFSEHFTEVARGLSDLAAEGSATLAGPELDVALTAREAVLDLLALVHRELTGVNPWGLTTRAVDIQSHPVASLSRALADQPRIPRPLSPSDALNLEVHGEAGQAWREIGRHAVLAGHDWDVSDKAQLTSIDAWTGVRDVAAVSAFLAVLDRDLAAAADALPDRQLDAAALHRGGMSGLEVIAREVVRIAASGPLTGTLEPATAGQLVVRVRQLQDLAPAERRLADLLRGSMLIRPERHQAITKGHLQVCQSVAAALKTSRDPAFTVAAHDLLEHSRLLANATARPTQLRSLEGGNLVPFWQASEIHQRLGAVLPGADPALLRRLLPDLGDVSAALADVARRHLSSGAWLVPSATTAEQEPVWTPADLRRQPPPQLQHLDAAATHARHLRSHVQAHGPSGDRPGPRWTPTLPAQTPERPTLPGHALTGWDRPRRIRR